jgi:AmmeMemoRadiSam system protein A
MHPLVELARRTVETYAREGRVPEPPAELVDPMAEHAGVFVSIKKGGELRGCIGTFLPTTDNVARETIRNAVAASTQDPRFPSVRPSELGELQYSVDVLGLPEDVESPDKLDVKRYGVIVSAGQRRGLLLPDLEGVDTIEYQLSIACMKAGISPDEPGLRIQRFEVRRYR